MVGKVDTCKVTVGLYRASCDFVPDIHNGCSCSVYLLCVITVHGFRLITYDVFAARSRVTMIRRGCDKLMSLMKHKC